MTDNTCGDRAAQKGRAWLRVGPIFTRFAQQDVPESCLSHVIELARLSPSPWNFQPWRWIVVRSESGKRQLESSTYIRTPLVSAPVVLICLADTLAWKTAPQHLHEMVENQKVTEEEAREALREIRAYYSASPENAQRTALANAFVALHEMLLAAADCELSAYWVTEFDERTIKDYFHIPDSFLVAALVALGYSDSPQLAPPRQLPLHSLIYEEKFGQVISSSR